MTYKTLTRNLNRLSPALFYREKNTTKIIPVEATSGCYTMLKFK